ncbi:hypothetical protein D3C78_1624110 [compost metagenome]
MRALPAFSHPLLGPSSVAIPGDPVALLRLAQDDEALTDDDHSFRTDLVDVAVVVWPRLLHFFRHDFVLAAAAAIKNCEL